MKRKLLLILLVGLFVGSLAVAHGEGGEQITVEGEILDMACYVPKGAKGPEHAKCAKACVKGGQPMGLLAADGQVYVLFASHDDATAFEQAKEHAGARVAIVGVVSERAGLKGLEVHAIKAM